MRFKDAGDAITKGLLAALILVTGLMVTLALGGVTFGK
jgi:hypothetical protein